MHPMRQAGRISNWNDDKGFGFVTPHDGGPRAFVHVKAFQVSARRPVDGDLISYDTAADAKGRLNATAVRFAGQRIVTPTKAPARKAKQRTPPMRMPRIPLGAGFLLAAIVLMVMGKVPAALSLLYLLMSCVTFIAYVLDKDAAGKPRRQRTPEATLHMMDFLGGWPGGLIAQQMSRHKTAKPSFQAGFWISVVSNLVLAGWLWSSGAAAAVTEILIG